MTDTEPNPSFEGQSADDQPYILFFHHDTRIGFAWDGSSQAIQVNQGGWGEPTVTEIPAPVMTIGVLVPGTLSIRRSLDLFHQSCMNYVNLILNRLVNTPKQENPYRPGEFDWADGDVQKEMGQ